MKLKTALSALIAAGIVAVPVAAQAGTAAGSSMVSARSLSAVGERRASTVKKNERALPLPLLIALLAVVPAGFAVSEIVSDDKSNG